MALSAARARGDYIVRASRITSHFIKDMITPAEVIVALNDAEVEFVLAGAYATNVWTRKPRATEDVDVVVASRHHRRALAAIRRAFPRLKMVDRQVVTRFVEPESRIVFLDIMKPREAITRAAFKNYATVSVDGEQVRIPDVEMTIAMKFAAMVGIWRQVEKKHIDASDFISIVKANPRLDTKKLERLGNLVYNAGGEEILNLVADARAGRRLEF